MRKTALFYFRVKNCHRGVQRALLSPTLQMNKMLVNFQCDKQLLRLFSHVQKQLFTSLG